MSKNDVQSGFDARTPFAGRLEDEPFDTIDDECSWYERNDIGNAQRFIARHGDGVIHIDGLGFAAWDGRRWSVKEGARLSKMLAHDTARQIRREALAMQARGRDEDESEKDFRERIAAHRRFAVATGNRSKLDNLLSEAAPYLSRLPEDLDADPFLLNVENGTLQLGDKARLVEHRRLDYITRLAGAAYDPDARAPTFERFVRTILPDDQVREFVQRFAGYLLTGDTSEQQICMFYGKGSNGKSTLVTCLRAVLGDYAETLPFAALLYDDRRRGSDASPELADLAGVRAAFASEPESGARFSESRLKELTGGEPIKVRPLFQKFFEFRPQFKLLASFNDKPYIRGATDGIWRRIRLVPFERKVGPDQVGPVHTELRREAPGILNWMLEGFDVWRRIGLSPPASIIAETDAYREDANPAQQFAADCLEKIDGGMVAAAHVYAAYEEWCKRSAIEPLSGNAFGRRMSELGFRREKVGTVAYVDVRLRQDIAEAAGVPPQDRSKAPRGDDVESAFDLSDGGS